MNKFEKLIEYVINEDDKKASDLFHEIVVEKSRNIYEGLMDDDMDDDQVGDLIDDVKADHIQEDDMDDEMTAMEPEGEEVGFGDGELDAPTAGAFGDEAEEDLEDRVVDLEDKLDELMAEFDSIIGDEEGMEPGMEPEMEPGMEPEMEPEMDDGIGEGIYEDVSLTKVTKGVSNSSEDADNKKSPVAANSGKRGMSAKPQQSSGEENGSTAPSVKDEGYTTQPNMKKVGDKAASKESKADNTKSPLAKA